MLLLEDRRFYVYAYLDRRRKGNFQYGIYLFEYEPFYIGKGRGLQHTRHLKESKYEFRRGNQHKYNKIRQIQRETNKDPIIILYRENLTELEAFHLEIFMISKIGRSEFLEGPLTNLAEGGTGGRMLPNIIETIRQKKLGSKHSEETKKLMSQRQRERISYASWTPEQKKKQSILLKNKWKNDPKFVEEQLKIIRSVDRMGEKHPMFGKHHSEDSKKKMSLHQTGKSRNFSKEEIEKRRRQFKAEGNPNYKEIDQNEVLKKIDKNVPFQNICSSFQITENGMRYKLDLWLGFHKVSEVKSYVRERRKMCPTFLLDV